MCCIPTTNLSDCDDPYARQQAKIGRAGGSRESLFPNLRRRHLQGLRRKRKGRGSLEPRPSQLPSLASYYSRRLPSVPRTGPGSASPSLARVPARARGCRSRLGSGRLLWRRFPGSRFLGDFLGRLLSSLLCFLRGRLLGLLRRLLGVSLRGFLRRHFLLFGLLGFLLRLSHRGPPVAADPCPSGAQIIRAFA